GVATTGKHHTVTVATADGLSIDHSSIKQAGLGGDAFSSRCNLSLAQRCQQIARENHALASSLGQALFDKEFGALLECCSHFAAETQITDTLAADDQLLIQPGGADHTGLPFDG